MKDKPERIYLSDGDEEGTVWHERIEQSDIEYVRADVISMALPLWVKLEMECLRHRLEDAQLVSLGLSNSGRCGHNAYIVVERGGEDLTVYDYEHYDGRCERVAVASLSVGKDGSVALTPAAREVLRRAREGSQ